MRFDVDLVNMIFQEIVNYDPNRVMVSSYKR